ncbi:Nucleotide-binding, alpha-beta plait [Metarhizium album ARSEF 1941]|uniref:Nucleotide-binding, alpha-beta plait n=1 Tax=Metarhizium album (strain ARSEF 1941) TaxID=1081103 RepID=A0A0B2WRB9_METAS|nr:Nucleotide-binding, alpha-beta plait [Metarhizium album ARSEF 1941]KHN96159.1 Nucleotide-binding, alpha-beta plait [Metarhizium album ARSEF 1941]
MANPVGEDAWLAYIQEHARVASNLEQRVDVVELYKRAVGDEPGSMRLWLAYCNYFWQLWESSNSGDAGWSEEEQTLGREVFSFGAALDLWQQGYEAVQYRLSDSHELWNVWLSFEMEQFVKSKTPEGLRRITHLYRQRLATPHLTWDETSQAFSSFLSEYNQQEWERTMQDTTASAQVAKKAIQVRDPFELKLRQAQLNGDVEAEKAQLREYLDWEVRGIKRQQDGAQLTRNICSGLFDRALTGLFANDEDTWHDYLVFISSSMSDFQSSADRLLDASRRSVLHCPWSGGLWSRYILCAEEANLAFSDIESIKHAATSENQLYKNGMTSMIEMYGAWCAFLKRTALEPAASDEAADVAEVGLRAAIEDVEVTGRRLYGKKFQGDPKYRLEHLYIQYLTEKKGAVEDARAQWKRLAQRRVHADSYDFWFNYYMWEMLVFSSKQNNEEESSPHKGLHIPTTATAVLRSAATRKTIDWPERVLEMYQQHCNNYELPSLVRQADDFVNETRKILAYRRRKQEEQQAAQLAAYYETQAQVQGVQANEASVATVNTSSPPSGPKRKRESLTGIQEDHAENATKRQKDGDEISDAAGPPPKRDREHSTIIVTHLPADATQTAVRNYFKRYGHIKNITAFIKEDNGESTTALIEFGSTEEAQSALLRDAKYFGESQITVQPGHDLTVYVANYPPAADDTFIRDLFKDCGDILSIRRPSLKVNTHRRFCYVSFRDRDAAAKAVAKEGKLLEGKYRLLARYSDPNRKKHREGAVAEGREVHISNLDPSTTEADMRSVFGKFGTVRRVNIPLSMTGKNRGFAFLEFESKDQAEKAVAELNNTKFKARILRVEISTESKVKPSAKTDFQRTSASPAPSSLNNAQGDQAMGDAMVDDSPKPSSSEIAAKTIALMGLPDTVNDARVKALVEPLGAIVKLVHQPGHGGAIIEFADAASAGKAALQLSNMEYEGHKLRAGSPDELRKNRPDNKPAQLSKPKGLMAPPQAARRAFGRTGPKKGLAFAPRSVAATASKPADKEAGPKSNADFKAMFLAGNKEDEKE